MLCDGRLLLALAEGIAGAEAFAHCDALRAGCGGVDEDELLRLVVDDFVYFGLCAGGEVDKEDAFIGAGFVEVEVVAFDGGVAASGVVGVDGCAGTVGVVERFGRWHAGLGLLNGCLRGDRLQEAAGYVGIGADFVPGGAVLVAQVGEAAVHARVDVYQIAEVNATSVEHDGEAGFVEAGEHGADILEGDGAALLNHALGDSVNIGATAFLDLWVVLACALAQVVSFECVCDWHNDC